MKYIFDSVDESDYNVLEATSEIHIECGLLKAEDKERRRKLATSPPDLKNVFAILKGQVDKELVIFVGHPRPLFQYRIVGNFGKSS